MMMKTTTAQFTTTPKVYRNQKMQHENITKPWFREVETFQERLPNPFKTPFTDSHTSPVGKQAATDLSYHENHQGCHEWKTPLDSESSGINHKQQNHPAPWRRLFTADILQSPPPMGHADFAPQSQSAFKRRMSLRQGQETSITTIF